MAKKYIDAEHFDERARDVMGMTMDNLPMEYEGAVEAVLTMLETEPSVYVPRWIPVTERLPEQEGQYLVCCNNKHHQFEVARFYINYDGDRWFCCDWNDPEKIIAWMPLPEPYKGGERE